MQQRGHNGFLGAFIGALLCNLPHRVYSNLISESVRFPEEKKKEKKPTSSKSWKSGQGGECCTAGQLLSPAEPLEPSRCLMAAPPRALGDFFAQFL